MNQKANVGLIAVAIILALVILAIYLAGIATRDCNSNNDCSETSYCGSDFSCHEFPPEIVIEKNNWVWPALIFGVCLILASYIHRGGSLYFWKRGKSG